MRGRRAESGSSSIRVRRHRMSRARRDLTKAFGPGGSCRQFASKAAEFRSWVEAHHSPDGAKHYPKPVAPHAFSLGTRRSTNIRTEQRVTQYNLRKPIRI